MTRVAVVGGGLGGLTSALSLIRAGVSVDVYEQAPAFGDIGAGIGLFPNALKILDSLGFGRTLRERGFRQPELAFRRWQDGRVIGTADFEAVARPGMMNLTFHRAELIDMLVEALPADVLHLDHRLASVRQDATGVELRFVDGTTARADALVGADGVRSTVASATGLAEPARSSGYAAYRALVPAERIAPLGLGPGMGVWLGPDRHFAHYWIAGGRLLNVIGYVPDRSGRAEAWTDVADIADAREQYRNWHPTVRAMLDAVDEVLLFGLYDRLASDAWSVGRIALLGDAAHPMLPFFAQGGGQAIEDAATIGVLLGDAEPADVPARLARYSALRAPRARRVQEIARLNAVQNALPDGPLQQTRDERLGDPAQNVFAASDWLYDHDTEETARQSLPGATGQLG
jgi:salicylate hydroxylase